MRMIDHYAVLGVERNATLSEIKRAFREKAKQLHPDVAGSNDSAQMRSLLSSYEVLSNRELRFQYDKNIRPSPFGAARKKSFDYRTFLKERAGEPEFQAKLIFFDLFHFEEDDALNVWQAAGGLDFPLEQFLDREDWMDGGFVLAEELERHGFFYESFLLLTRLLAEERKKPYFRHFTEDVELLLKTIVRFKLRRAVPADEMWIACMRRLLELDFPPKEEARWLKSIGETFYKTGDLPQAWDAFQDARKKDARISISPKILAECEAAGFAK